MSEDWTLYVGDRLNGRQAQVDLYHSLALVIRHNAVSTWALELPTDSEAGAAFLDLENPRLIVKYKNQTVRSGPLTHTERVVSVVGDDLRLNGVDDLAWLGGRVAHPTPALAAPPYNTQGYDVRTGNAAQVLAQYIDVNAGPSAVAARRVPGLVVPVPAAAGPSGVTLSARYQSLAEFVLSNAEAYGLGVRIVDLSVSVAAPANTGAVFSLELGTMASLAAVADAPTSNFVYVAGQGTDTSRLIVEVSDAPSLATWGRFETFQDRRDTNDTAQLTQAGRETLTQAVKAPSVEFEVLDSPSQAFLTNWRVGDLATVQVGGEVRTDVIREVTVRLDGGKAVQMTARIGSSGDLALFRSALDQGRRIRQLERA